MILLFDNYVQLVGLNKYSDIKLVSYSSTIIDL